MSVKHYDWSAYHAYVRPTKIAIRDLSAKQSLTYKELEILQSFTNSLEMSENDSS